VTLLVRGDDLQTDMSRYLVHRIGREPRIRVLLHTEVRELLGDDVLSAVTVEDKATSDLYRLDARALFICAEPHTRWLAGRVALDRHGFVLTGADAVGAAKALSDVDGSPAVLETSRTGVFAVGDVRSGSIKRIAAAVGEGSIAVRLVHEHLAGRRAQANASST
jgi:thioredoxin reductase (NADPH)